MVDAKRCPRPGLKATFRNGRPANCTNPITSIGNSPKSALDLLQSRPALLQQRSSLGKLESDGAAFRIMLIINIGVLPSRTHRANVLTQRLQEGILALPLSLEKDPEPRYVNHGLQGYRQ